MAQGVISGGSFGGLSASGLFDKFGKGFGDKLSSIISEKGEDFSLDDLAGLVKEMKGSRDSGDTKMPTSAGGSGTAASKAKSTVAASDVSGKGSMARKKAGAGAQGMFQMMMNKISRKTI